MKREEKRVRAARRIGNVFRELKAQQTDFLYPLCRLVCMEREDIGGPNGFYTDGLHVFYSPDYVVNNGNATLKSDIMHLVLHGLMGHFENQESMPWFSSVLNSQVDVLMEQMGIPNVYMGGEGNQINRHQGLMESDARARELFMIPRGDYTKRSTWQICQKDGAGEEMSNMWKTARQCVIASIEDRLTDGGFLLWIRQAETGMARWDAQEILRGGNIPENLQKVRGMDYENQWKLTGSLCKLLAQEAESEEGDADYARISHQINRLLDFLGSVDEQGILKEKGFCFINRHKALLRAVSMWETPEYLKMCRKILGEMGQNRYV